MDSYDTLVSKVLKNEALAKAVSDMADGSLNLVAADWERRLNNDISLQDYSNGSPWKTPYATESYVHETSNLPDFQVVIVGYCKFGKLDSSKRKRAPYIVVVDSEPLTKIARAMTTDLGPQINISNEFKFSFTECSVWACSVCSDCAARFKKSGCKVSSDSNQPCILLTKVYDGTRVVNRFESQMESMFQSRFLAILSLKINARYCYWDTNKEKIYRINGKNTDIVAFNENKLTATAPKEVDLGVLIDFESEGKHTTADDVAAVKCKEAKEDDVVEEFQKFISKKRKFEEEETDDEACVDVEEFLLT